MRDRKKRKLKVRIEKEGFGEYCEGRYIPMNHSSKRYYLGFIYEYIEELSWAKEG